MWDGSDGRGGGNGINSPPWTRVGRDDRLREGGRCMCRVNKEDSGAYKRSQSHLAGPKVQRHEAEGDPGRNGEAGDGNDGRS